MIDDYDIVDTNPSVAFDNFSYDVVDETVDDLKKDIITLDSSINNSLTTRYAKPSTSELALRDMYKEYGDKLGMRIGYTDFKDYISHVAENNKIQRDIIEAINAKIAIDISQRAITKLILSFNTLIDRSTAMILRQTEGDNAEFTPEIVGMADKCMQWAQQLIDLKEQTSSKMSDPDKTIDKIVSRVKGQLEEEKSKGNTQDQGVIINDIVERLKLEYSS